jgi:hypothetical protein
MKSRMAKSTMVEPCRRGCGLIRQLADIAWMQAEIERAGAEYLGDGGVKLRKNEKQGGRRTWIFADLLIVSILREVMRTAMEVVRMPLERSIAGRELRPGGKEEAPRWKLH